MYLECVRGACPIRFTDDMCYNQFELDVPDYAMFAMVTIFPPMITVTFDILNFHFHSIAVIICHYLAYNLIT